MSGSYIIFIVYIYITVGLPDWLLASTWITTRTKVRAASDITALVCFANCYKNTVKKDLFGPKNRTVSTTGRTVFWLRFLPLSYNVEKKSNPSV